MKRTFTTATLVAAATFASSASAEIIASWDNWADTSASNLDADFSATGVTAYITDADGVFDERGDGIRDISGSNGSTDGTFGTLAGATGGGDGALRLSKQTPNLLIHVTLMNGTGEDLDLDVLYFDFAPNSDGHDEYSVSFYNETTDTDSGELGSSGGELVNIGGSGNYHDAAINASGITLADGETGRFVISLTGNEGNNSSSFLDNVAVTIIPEPSSLALVGLGGLCLLRRRR